jgi:hypothetical protein
MAKRTKNQSTGDIGEASLKLLFTAAGYACSDIKPDFGQDFFVYPQDVDEIEPFKIFVQSKASATFDSVTSDWTEYEDPMTVRNWVLGNELTVVIRQNFTSGDIKYCIPEEEIDHRKIDYGKLFPVRILTNFEGKNTVEQLIWRARIRHYHRLVQLAQPSEFDKGDPEEVPSYRLFLAEFLARIGILGSGSIKDGALEIYTHFFGVTALTMDFVAGLDLSIHEKLRYSACMQLVLQRLAEVSFGQGLVIIFADQCACLLVQFVIEEEKKGRAIRPRSDAEWQKIRFNILLSASSRSVADPFLTDWYSGSVKPEHAGVYQRDDGSLSFSVWNGNQWCGKFSAFNLPPDTPPPELRQDLTWRGVAEANPTLAQTISELVLGGV